MNEKQEAALERINELLAEVQSEINKYWGPEIDENNEIRLFIQDKRTNPWRKQVEDIEGDVQNISASGR